MIYNFTKLALVENTTGSFLEEDSNVQELYNFIREHIVNLEHREKERIPSDAYGQKRKWEEGEAQFKLSPINEYSIKDQSMEKELMDSFRESILLSLENFALENPDKFGTRLGTYKKFFEQPQTLLQLLEAYETFISRANSKHQKEYINQVEKESLFSLVDNLLKTFPSSLSKKEWESFRDEDKQSILKKFKKITRDSRGTVMSGSLIDVQKEIEKARKMRKTFYYLNKFTKFAEGNEPDTWWNNFEKEIDLDSYISDTDWSSDESSIQKDPQESIYDKTRESPQSYEKLIDQFDKTKDISEKDLFGKNKADRIESIINFYNKIPTILYAKNLIKLEKIGRNLEKSGKVKMANKIKKVIAQSFEQNLDINKTYEKDGVEKSISISKHNDNLEVFVKIYNKNDEFSIQQNFDNIPEALDFLSRN